MVMPQRAMETTQLKLTLFLSEVSVLRVAPRTGAEFIRSPNTYLLQAIMS